MSDVETRVKGVIEDILGEIHDWDLNFSLKDLGADSLDIGEIALELEEEFDITIPEENVDQFTTIGDIVTYLEQ